MARASTLGFVLICTILAFRCDLFEAAEFRVGDSDGWGFVVKFWPNGRRLHAGDVLVFNYPVGLHNVVVADAEGYETCTLKRRFMVYSSGNDKITLVKGHNYFICGIAHHCQADMKIDVYAE